MLTKIFYYLYYYRKILTPESQLKKSKAQQKTAEQVADPTNKLPLKELLVRLYVKLLLTFIFYAATHFLTGIYVSSRASPILISIIRTVAIFSTPVVSLG